MTEIITGLVIKTDRVGETDARVTLLTPHGKRTFTARGIEKAKSKLRPAVQLFTTAEWTVVEHTLASAHVQAQNRDITRDIKKYYLACAICSVIADAIPQNAHGDINLIYELTTAAIAQCADPATPAPALFADFFTALLRALGYDVDENTDINTAFARHLDIKIPNTKYFL